MGLKIRDVSDAELTIARRIYRRKEGPPKSKRGSRIVPLRDASTCNVLRQYLSIHPDPSPDAWLFPSENPKRPLDYGKVFRRRIRPALEHVGLKWVNYQVMRRTFGNKLAEVEKDARVRADLMGHSVARERISSGAAQGQETRYEKNWRIAAMIGLCRAVVPVEGANTLILWSGRRGSNPRRPAWEAMRHFNFKHLESAGVGLESTETPGKTAVNRKRPLNGVQLECSAIHAISPARVLRPSSKSPAQSTGGEWRRVRRFRRPCFGTASA
jgi:hypothetical protein